MHLDFRPMLQSVSGLLLLFILFGSLFLDARVWTTRDGTKSQGELIEVEGDRIGIRIHDRDYHFSINRFSDQDQDYVRQWAEVSRCPICLRGLRGKTKRTSTDEFHAECFRCMVCDKGFVGGNASSETHGEDCLTSITARLLHPVGPVHGFSSVVKRNPLSYLRMVA
ncbi:MAG: LIM domain-containing protein [Opitutales bacterium]